jgi:urease accessory protein
MTLPANVTEVMTGTDLQPRALGAARLAVKPGARGDGLSALRMSGSLKLLFPRPAGRALEAVLVNTAGGITGGDSFSVEATAEPGASLSLTTQAAERAYRASGARPGRLATRLAAGQGARLAWLPQETILFEGSFLRRSLSVELAADARFLMVEPVIFGRAAMGEELHAARFHDRVEIRRAGALIWFDALRLEGDLAAQMDRPALGGGARAMASLVYAGPDAEAFLGPLRALLPQTAGASLVRGGLLAARLLAADGYDLRRALIPAIRLLNSNEIPKPWML